MKKLYTLIPAFILLTVLLFSCAEESPLPEAGEASTPLLTIKMPSSWMGPEDELTFVVSDDAGKILNSTKYEAGATTIKLESKVPYDKDRLSIFLLRRSLVNRYLPRIDAYMNVKKGSVWVQLHPSLPSIHQSILGPVNVRNVPAFDMVAFSTDAGANTFASSGKVDIFQNGSGYMFSDSSKIFFQVEKAGKAFYHLFDIVKGSKVLDIDLSLCTTPSLSKKITVPGVADVTVYGRKDKNYLERYSFGQKRITGGAGEYFYPNEKYAEYYTLISYYLNEINYTNSFKGPEIAQTASPINLSFEPNGRSLATFKPTFAGDFDYYRAQFANDGLGIEVVSPSAALSFNLVFPDLAAYAGFSGFKPLGLQLKTMEAVQYAGFSEDMLNYKIWPSDELTGKAISRMFHE